MSVRLVGPNRVGAGKHDHLARFPVRVPAIVAAVDARVEKMPLALM